MLKLILLSLVGVAFGQVERCCTPDVWEGTVMGMYGQSAEGVPSFGQNFDRVHYDYRERMFAWYHRTDFNDETIRSFRIINNHEAGRRYFIEGGTCHYSELSREMRRDCVSESAEYRGLVYFGSGENALRCGRWEERYDVGATYFTRTEANEGCVPVNAVRFIEGTPTHHFDYAASLTFADIVPEIEDPEVFIPPETCTPEPFPADVEALSEYQMLKAMHYL